MKRLTAQQVAERAGVSTSTVYYYCKLGLIQPPKQGRTYVFSPYYARAVRRVADKLVNSTSATLEEIEEMLERMDEKRAEWV